MGWISASTTRTRTRSRREVKARAGGGSCHPVTVCNFTTESVRLLSMLRRTTCRRNLLYRDGEWLAFPRDEENQKLYGRGLACVLVVMHDSRRQTSCIALIYRNGCFSAGYQHHRAFLYVGASISRMIVPSDVCTGSYFNLQDSRFLPRYIGLGSVAKLVEKVRRRQDPAS